jgi:hypothetical protein
VEQPLDSEFYFLICQMLAAPFVIVFRVAELTRASAYFLFVDAKFSPAA